MTGGEITGGDIYRGELARGENAGGKTPGGNLLGGKLPSTGTVPRKYCLEAKATTHLLKCGWLVGCILAECKSRKVLFKC